MLVSESLIAALFESYKNIHSPTKFLVKFLDYIRHLQLIPHKMRRLPDAIAYWNELKAGIPNKLLVFQSCLLNGNVNDAIWNESDGRSY